MAGIYLHIPFCKQACHYCNFHFSTSLKYKGEMVTAIVRELELQRNYLQGATLETIYLGGGTPSLLSEKELGEIFEAIYRLHPVIEHPEITLEANPDDLTPEKIQALKHSPVNRLSIGIQSFSEEDLRFMNRAHSAAEAERCIELAQDAGFENLTVDLIYGAPTTSDAQWQSTMQRVIAADVPHISCYALTVEEKTALAHFIKAGKVPPVDEEKSARQFEQLMHTLQAAGYDHYEISNFAKPGCYARHNSNYWKGVSYLGVGPSAHSFNGESRQWNVANNAQYLKAIQQDEVPFEQEILTPEQRYNEYVMTSLRTIWGCDLGQIRQFGPLFERYFLKHIEHFLADGTVERRDDKFFLSENGRLLADRIAMELFVD